MSKRIWLGAVLVCLLLVHLFAFYRIPTEYYLRHAEWFSTPLADILDICLLAGAASLLLTLPLSYALLRRIPNAAALIYISLTLTFLGVNALFGQSDPRIDEQFNRIDLEAACRYSEKHIQ